MRVFQPQFVVFLLMSLWGVVQKKTLVKVFEFTELFSLETPLLIPAVQLRTSSCCSLTLSLPHMWCSVQGLRVFKPAHATFCSPAVSTIVTFCVSTTFLPTLLLNSFESVVLAYMLSLFFPRIKLILTEVTGVLWVISR